MSNLLKMMAGSAAEPLYVDDVFSAYTYTGNGSTQTITNGIDLAGEGGLVWIKHRGSTGTRNHQIADTARGMTFSSAKFLRSNLTEAQADLADFLRADSVGFTLGSASNDYAWNFSAETYISWTFRNAPKFFDHQTVTLSAGNATVSFTDLETLGMVIVKRTDSTGDWYVWHRSLTAGKLLYLNQTAAEATLGHITVSGTTLTLVDGVLADGNYICYGFAHDTGTDGMIQCGSFTTDGSGNATVNLGWEPQFVMTKNSSGTSAWRMFDTSRGMTVAGQNDALLQAQTSTAEITNSDYASPTATGFQIAGHEGSVTFIYLAIRRPNKPPTVGTQVYNAIAYTGDGIANRHIDSGIVTDLTILKWRTSDNMAFFDRLRGGGIRLSPYSILSENVENHTSYSLARNGITATSTTSAGWNYSSFGMIGHFFRRAPGVFDEVCYTGTGAAHTEAHNLGAVPELMIVKGRSGATQWEVYSAALANTEKLILNSTAAKATDTASWNSTTPTATVLTVGTGANVNTNTATYVAYLFATLAGISKVGSYTGNGSSLTINCGFTTGARFILIKRTDSTGDWYMWDTVRGIIAGNDPHLSLNTTAAEVTSDDSIDPDTSGFIVNQLAATNVNVTSATYIFLAFA